MDIEICIHEESIFGKLKLAKLKQVLTYFTYPLSIPYGSAQCFPKLKPSTKQSHVDRGQCGEATQWCI